MARQDPYDILGVVRGASLDEVRQAFRRAVLLCHPDLHPANRIQAEQKFRTILDAYQAVLQDLAADAPPKFTNTQPISPMEMALMDSSWLSGLSANRAYTTDKPPHPGQQAVKVPMATRNETRLFLWTWLPTTIVTAVGALILGESLGQWGYLQGFGAAAMMLIAVLGYVLLLATAVGAILLTRKVIYMVFPSHRKALPAPYIVTFPSPTPQTEFPVDP